MESNELKPIIESLIFVSDGPLTESALMDALAETGADKAQVRDCVDMIEKDYDEDTSRGMHIVRVAGGLQFRTKEPHSQWLKKLSIPKPMRLTGPSLETLAIIAYRQPIVRSEIEKIRGVDSGAVLKTLLDKRLLRIVGKMEEPGQPLLYGTTKEFMELFNLSNLTDLPTLKDVEELMRERRAVTEAPAEVLRAEFGQGENSETIAMAGESDQTIELPEFEATEEHAKDMEALGDLEKSLKDLRRMERNIFPKEVLNELEGKNVSSAGADVPAGAGAPPVGGDTRSAESDDVLKNAPPKDDSAGR